MNDLLQKSAVELAEELREGSVTSERLTELFLERIDAVDPALHCFLSVDREGALEQARLVDERRAEGEQLHPFAGVPIAIKDNIVTEGLETTAGSKILSGWVPPYDATVVQRIREAGLPILGKTNMDEFAMGSSTEFSAFGVTRNPWDLNRVPGGSGGGSAAAVAAFLTPWALGSDTGGSIRQPSAFTGTVGVKPTYGAVSRYGAIALASSLDQVGPVARTVTDAAALQEIIGGHDRLDSTSLPTDPAGLLEAVEAVEGTKKAEGLRVGVVKELSADGYSAPVLEAFERTVQQLRDSGAEIVEVSCPSFDYAMAAYYLIMPAEASSNLARFDGMRFGLRVEPESGPITEETVMAATREAGFGTEVKRRIILGTHVLSSGFYDSYYGAAQKIRTLIQRDFERAFEQADVLVSPATPTTAFPFGERVEDPLAMYLNDAATVPANMAGIPAMSVPNGVGDEGLPVGLQILAPAQRDELMYEVAQLVENMSEPYTSEYPVEYSLDIEEEGK